MAQNIGQACLQTIASIWQVDDSSIKWFSNGFDWTPGSHLVGVRASTDESSGRWRISVETNVLKAVSLNAKKFITGVAAQSGVLTSTYSIQYPPLLDEGLPADQARLTHFSSIYLDANLVSWLPLGDRPHELAVSPFAGIGMAVLRSRDPVLSEKREPIELGVADFWHVDTKATMRCHRHLVARWLEDRTILACL
jgi:hypothetical protein